jgi:hypothetical protein
MRIALLIVAALVAAIPALGVHGLSPYGKFNVSGAGLFDQRLIKFIIFRSLESERKRRQLFEALLASVSSTAAAQALAKL